MPRQKVEILTPIGRVRAGAPRTPSPRPQEYQGKILGLLETRKPNSDVFMDQIQRRLLGGGLGFAAVIRRRKPTIANEPTPKKILAELAQRCSLVIHGIAD